MICFVSWDNVCVDGVTNYTLAYEKKKSAMYFWISLPECEAS